MKKSFFELMDNYEPEDAPEEYNISAENVKEIVMRKIDNHESKAKIRISRKAIAVMAAVATVTAVGIGAAAYTLGRSSNTAHKFFETYNAVSKADNGDLYASSRVLDVEDIKNIDANIHEENTVIESNGSTIELTGSMYDDQSALLFFTLTAPEGTVIDSDSGYEFADSMFDFEGSGCGAIGGYTEFSDDVPGDNVINFTYDLQYDGDGDRYAAKSIKGIHFQDLAVWNKMAWYGDEPKDVVVEGEWYVPLNLTEKVQEIELLDGPVEVSYQTNTGTRTDIIDSLIISTLGIKTTETIDCNYRYYYENTLKVVMKDGSEAEINDSRFGTPVDLTQVDYVEVCGQKFELDS